MRGFGEGIMMGALILLLVLVTLTTVGDAHPTEASGQVVHIVDGDTFDVEIEQADRDLEDVIRIRLADIDCPETRGSKACQAGRDATNYTREMLAGEWIYLDLDDKTGQDRYARWVAVVYLQDRVGEDAPLPRGPCFNRMLVDAGHAVIDDYTNNEFNPVEWWE